jgi:hypothetical protein
MQAVLNAQSEAASKRRRFEAGRVPTAVSSPSISRSYGKYIGFVCFLSVYEVAKAVRCSSTAPTPSSLHKTVEKLKNETAYRALAANNLPIEEKRVKGCQIDMYVVLTHGTLPSDELRFGSQEVFFRTLKDLMPQTANKKVMWNQLSDLVQYYADFNINKVRNDACPFKLPL